jgi:hypothetical protein
MEGRRMVNPSHGCVITPSSNVVVGSLSLSLYSTHSNRYVHIKIVVEEEEEEENHPRTPSPLSKMTTANSFPTENQGIEY